MACGSRKVVGVPEPLRRPDRPGSRWPGILAGRMSPQAPRPPIPLHWRRAEQSAVDPPNSG